MTDNFYTATPRGMITVSTPKLLILGHGQHGKDEAAKIIAKRYDLKLGGSSEAAFDAIKPGLKKLFPEIDDDQLFAERRIHRETWRRLIKEFNTPDRTRLTRLVLNKYDGYVGLRDLDEYNATKNIYDIIVWIDGGLRKPSDPSMQIKYNAKTMIFIDNNGPLDRLKDEIAGKLDGLRY